MEINHTQSKEPESSIGSSLIVWRSAVIPFEIVQEIRLEEQIKFVGFVSATQNKDLAEKHALTMKR
jgi:hypothetical protein